MLIATFEARKQALVLLQAVAGELDARYDAVTGRWSYKRDGKARILYLLRQEPRWHGTRPSWEVHLEGTK